MEYPALSAQGKISVTILHSDDGAAVTNIVWCEKGEQGAFSGKGSLNSASRTCSDTMACTDGSYL